MVERIVSGGQTGADRGGLVGAVALGIPHGGWCPKGRRAEDGRVPDEFALDETPSSDYQVRTRWNVRDSDGTVIFTKGSLTGGSRLTAETAKRMQKPVLHLEMALVATDFGEAYRRFWAWLQEHSVRVLNVAGSRESKALGIEEAVARFLGEVLRPERVPREYAGEAERPFSGPPLPLAAESAEHAEAGAKSRAKAKQASPRRTRSRGKTRPSAS